jgi:hypothetical protein
MAQSSYIYLLKTFIFENLLSPVPGLLFPLFWALSIVCFLEVLKNYVSGDRSSFIIR